MIIYSLSLGNRVPKCLGKSCQFCLPSVDFVAALLYLSVPLVLGIDVDLIVSVPSSLIYFRCINIL